MVSIYNFNNFINQPTGTRNRRQAQGDRGPAEVHQNLPEEEQVGQEEGGEDLQAPGQQDGEESERISCRVL